MAEWNRAGVALASAAIGGGLQIGRYAPQDPSDYAGSTLPDHLRSRNSCGTGDH